MGYIPARTGFDFLRVLIIRDGLDVAWPWINNVDLLVYNSISKDQVKDDTTVLILKLLLKKRHKWHFSSSYDFRDVIINKNVMKNLEKKRICLRTKRFTAMSK